MKEAQNWVKNHVCIALYGSEGEYHWFIVACMLPHLRLIASRTKGTRQKDWYSLATSWNVISLSLLLPLRHCATNRHGG